MRFAIHLLLLGCLGLLTAVAGVPVRFCLLTGDLVPAGQAEASGEDGCCSDCTHTPEQPAACCLELDATADLTPSARTIRPVQVVQSMPGAEARPVVSPTIVSLLLVGLPRVGGVGWAGADLLLTLGFWRL